MWPSEFNKERYSEIWTDLNRRLKHIERNDGGLAAALEALRNQQRDQGFIKDDLHSVRRYRFAHPEDPTRFFSSSTTRYGRCDLRALAARRLRPAPA